MWGHQLYETVSWLPATEQLHKHPHLVQISRTPYRCKDFLKLTDRSRQLLPAAFTPSPSLNQRWISQLDEGERGGICCSITFYLIWHLDDETGKSGFITLRLTAGGGGAVKFYWRKEESYDVDVRALAEGTRRHRGKFGSCRELSKKVNQVNGVCKYHPWVAIKWHNFFSLFIDMVWVKCIQPICSQG